jgi:hypothetical protein
MAGSLSPLKLTGLMSKECAALVTYFSIVIDLSAAVQLPADARFGANVAYLQRASYSCTDFQSTYGQVAALKPNDDRDSRVRLQI